tara:strand:- start:3315 stop:3965 length:651 start_codon:yes stop_codon:yes gene_type:complete
MDEELDLITELAALNNGTYRETLIGNFQQEYWRQILLENLQQEYVQQIRQPGFIEGLLLMQIEDNSANTIIPSFSNNYVDNIINSSFYDKPVYKNVLDPTAENQLNLTSYKNTDKTNIECPITQEKFLDDTEVIVLPCNHIFMPSAIKQWVYEENASCPICRYKLRSIEKKIIDPSENTYTIPTITLPNLFENLITNLYSEENEIQEALVSSLSDH